MIIQYASDLHLEFHENKTFLKQTPLAARGEILILAGDIVPFAVMNKHGDFFDYVSDNFETCYWIPGNHEYYGYDLAKKPNSFKESIKSNLFLVNNISEIHQDTKFIFSTLWSKISPANQWMIERGVSDFHVIKYNGYRFSSNVFNQLHENSIEFIKNELKTSKSENTIVVSHHVPTLMNYSEKYKGSTINEAFAVELFDQIENSSADYWIYGHSHHNTPNFKIGKTELLTNQLGYVKYGENDTFEIGKTIEL